MLNSGFTAANTQRALRSSRVQEFHLELLCMHGKRLPNSKPLETSLVDKLAISYLQKKKKKRGPIPHRVPGKITTNHEFKVSGILAAPG